MPDSKIDHAILKIISGTLENTISQFLIERHSRRLSKASIYFYERYLAEFSAWMDRVGVVQLEELTPDILRKFFLSLEGAGHNAGGIHCYYRCVRALLTWWEEETDGDYRSPMKKVRPPKVTIQPLPGVPVAAIQKLIEACATSTAIRDRAILLCLLDTGCRRAEYLALNLADVDLVTGAVRIQHGKGDKARTVFLGARSRKALLRYLKTRPELRQASPLFANLDGSRLSSDGLKSMIRRRAAAAGIDPPGLHDFRRCFAIEMKRNGVDVVTISRMLGHSSLQVTLRYLSQNDEDFQAAHKKGSPVDNAIR